VATGETLRMIVEERGGGQIYGFDSFQSLPEPWLPGMPAGTFAQEDLPEVGGAQLVGLFENVLPAFLEEHPGPVDFLHVDSDLYSSAKTVLELVGPRLRTGGVVHFDEFFNYPAGSVMSTAPGTSTSRRPAWATPTLPSPTTTVR